MLKPLVLGAEAARRAVSLASRVPEADLIMARGAMSLGRWSTPTVEARTDGRARRIHTLQEQASAVLLEANPSGTEALLRRLDVGTITNPDRLEQLAARCLRIRRYEPALAMRRRAVELDPRTAHRWVALFHSLVRAGDGGTVNDPVAGLAPGPEVHQEEARDALKRAEELAPGNAHILHLRGKFEFEHGDAAAGLEKMREAAALAPNFRVWLDLASSYRKPHIADNEQAMEAYEKALELNPTSPQAIRGLVITGCRGTLDWERLWRNALFFERHKRRHARARAELMDQLTFLFTEAPTGSGIREALHVLEAAESKGNRLSWPTTALISYRIQFAGHFTEGLRLRRRLAERTLAWLGTTSAGHTRHRQKVLGALVYLDRYAEAQKLIDPMPWEPADQLSRQRLEKMAADVHLMQGRDARYIDYARQHQSDLHMPGDEKMDKLVRGRRVAVVGPADTGDRLGELIDSYDVVLRPRYAPDVVAQQADRLGSRTDVAYFSGRDLDDAMEEMSRAAESGDLQLVVGRGLSFEALTGESPDWLRFNRHDFSLYYHGGTMAIARMVYDVLQFAPEEICIFNIDFYTGLNAFSAGYRPETDQGFGPHSIMNDLVLAHDMWFEFRFIKAMMATGRVRAAGVAEEVLNLSDEEYLRRLDDSPSLRERS